MTNILRPKILQDPIYSRDQKNLKKEINRYSEVTQWQALLEFNQSFLTTPFPLNHSSLQPNLSTQSCSKTTVKVEVIQKTSSSTWEGRKFSYSLVHIGDIRIPDIAAP